MTTLVAGISLMGCAATQVTSEAQIIEIVNEKPDANKCKFVGEIIGSQGNSHLPRYSGHRYLTQMEVSHAPNQPIKEDLSLQ